MKKESKINYYDIFYKTKSGRGMVAKKIAAKNVTMAKMELKKQMRASTSFDKIVMVIKL